MENIIYHISTNDCLFSQSESSINKMDKFLENLVLRCVMAILGTVVLFLVRIPEIWTHFLIFQINYRERESDRERERKRDKNMVTIYSETNRSFLCCYYGISLAIQVEV